MLDINILYVFFFSDNRYVYRYRNNKRLKKHEVFLVFYLLS